MFWFIYSRPKFSTQISYLFIIKIRFIIKVNSICGAGRGTRNLCHKFNSQSPALRILGLRVANPKSQWPSSGILGVRVPCLRVLDSQVRQPRVLVPGSWVSVFHSPRSQGPEPLCPGPQGPRVLVLKVSGSRVSESQGCGSQGLRVPGPGSRVLILDCAFLKCSKPSIFQERSN